MLSIELKSPQDIQREIAGRFQARRLAMNLTQEGLAERSGVSWGSLKRFETTGLIALDSLLKLALVLDCLGGFDRLGAGNTQNLGALSLDAILMKTKSRRRASNKKAEKKGRIV